jgi:predicted TIM-barrel fold metal-dependent hydrolase
MKPTSLLDVPIIDGHIHLNHLERIDDIVALMDAARLYRANLVCTPNPGPINHNPALMAFKARYPGRAYISGALDYSQVFADRERMPDILAAQVYTLVAIGFDGLKMTEGKPTKRKHIPIPLDAPGYEGLWATLEALQVPVVLHVGDPELFWDPERCPQRARERGWYYGGGDYPLKEDLHTEVEHVLQRHPRLKAILAHFHFLSADLERAGRFLDQHPNVCYDLAPGSEMYNNFTRMNGHARGHSRAREQTRAREFFLRYQDRLIYGTDTTTGQMERDGVGMQSRARALEQALGRQWVVRTFLETDRAFTPPEGLERWLEPDLPAFQGLALPRQVLLKIYRANLERLYGPVPARLDREAAWVETERMAGALDEQAGGQVADNHARRALAVLGATTAR